jgi:hypothetical protein
MPPGDEHVLHRHRLQGRHAFLECQEVLRHGGTAARRHGGTAARRHGGTAARLLPPSTTPVQKAMPYGEKPMRRAAHHLYRIS